MLHSDRVFYRVLFAGIAVCLALYAEEAAHLVRSRGNAQFDIAGCRAVANSDRDIECPIKGYGWERYRMQDPRHPSLNTMLPVERNQ